MFLQQIMCNVIPVPEWIQHLKSSTHKNNAKLFLQKLKEKLPAKTNKRYDCKFFD
jgi:hypothetical protein